MTVVDPDKAIAAKFRSRWTPEMFDQFEADVRWLLEASPDLRDQPEAREEIIATLKKRAIDMVRESR